MTKILLATAITLIAAGLCATAWAKAPNTAPWSYAGPSGPENWGKLKSEYSLCKAGQEQSPIDIQNAFKYPFKPVSFNYRPNKFTVLNNGHTIQVSAPNSGSVSLPSGTFSLVQIHFHAPAEEKIQGHTYPLGVHLVHRNDAGELAIIALMYEEGAHNTALEPIFAAMPRSAGGRVTLNNANIADLLPENHNAYAFMGSLTEPPCTEGVRWNVLTTAVQLSQAQLEAFRAIYPMNARPIQPLNDRSVVVGN